MFRILVVDDDKNVRYVMRELLELENYTVFTAENGERALEMMLDTAACAHTRCRNDNGRFVTGIDQF